MPQFSIISDVLNKVLREHGLGSGDSLAKLRKIWTSSVGDKIAQHSSPYSLREGRLTLTVDSPAWMSQLSMLSPQIMEKLNAALEEVSVKELKFTLGAPNADEPKKASAAPIKKRALSKEEKEAVEEAAARITDAELKRCAKSLLTQSCKRVR